MTATEAHGNAPDADAQKRAAAAAAADEVSSGMTLGLGTGSTAEAFVRAVGERLRDGTLQNLRAICTSSRTEELARALSIPLVAFSEITNIDLAVDGADEIDPNLRLIKGLGGALLREKIVEQSASRFIVVADESKLVERLGRGLLPVEVVKFALDPLLRRFSLMELHPSLRIGGSEPFVTDEGHYILDVKVPRGIDIEETVSVIRDCAGVVDTGYFKNEATDAIIAGPTGLRRMSRG